MVADAADGGLVIGDPEFPEPDTDKWTVNQAVFFSSTILTTIGQYRTYLLHKCDF